MTHVFFLDYVNLLKTDNIKVNVSQLLVVFYAATVIPPLSTISFVFAHVKNLLISHLILKVNMSLLLLYLYQLLYTYHKSLKRLQKQLLRLPFQHLWIPLFSLVPLYVIYMLLLFFPNQIEYLHHLMKVDDTSESSQMCSLRP